MRCGSDGWNDFPAVFSCGREQFASGSAGSVCEARHRCTGKPVACTEDLKFIRAGKGFRSLFPYTDGGRCPHGQRGGCVHKRDGSGSLSVPGGGKGVAERRLAGTSECRITDCGCTKAGGANGSVTESGGANGSITESGGANGSIAEAGWARRGGLYRAGADALQ